MSISESARYHLYEAARTGQWDDQAADALMSLLPPVGWADVATKQDLAALEASIRGELHKEIGFVHREIGLVHHELGALRGEMSHQTRTFIVSVAALMVAGAGIALGTAQLVS